MSNNGTIGVIVSKIDGKIVMVCVAIKVFQGIQKQFGSFVELKSSSELGCIWVIFLELSHILIRKHFRKIFIRVVCNILYTVISILCDGQYR